MPATLSSPLRQALDRLERGQVIIHPTESVYGFGGSLQDGPLAVLQDLKGRAAGGFVVLIPSADAVKGLLGSAARALAGAFWPGALTLAIDDPDDRFHPAVQAADGSVAVRVPGHDLLGRLLRAWGRPMTSSSANAPGAEPARTAEVARAVASAGGHDLFALDDGPLKGGEVSTIVRANGPEARLIREGGIAVSRLNEVVKVAG